MLKNSTTYGKGQNAMNIKTDLKLPLKYFDKVNALRELQSATGEELDASLPSVLDRAFKGEL